MRFIDDTDFIEIYQGKKRLYLIEKEMIKKCFDRVNKFLIDCYSNKLLIQLDNGEISSIDEIKKNMMSFINSLKKNPVRIGKNYYNVLFDKGAVQLYIYWLTNFESTYKKIERNGDKPKAL